VTAAVIDVRDLEFGWAPDRPLLRIERLAIPAAERVFVHGPSGSGKSSLLSLLAGVVVPQRGSLRVLGTEVPRLAGAARDAFRADHFGVIFQMFNLVPYLSVLDNVTLPCRFSSRRRRQVDARGGADREAQRLLEHLDLAPEAHSPRAVTRLSVGQQQRVAAARALIGRPEIVLADEPTSALDADRREAFLRLLFRECEAEGATLLFVSHDRSLEGLFDRTLALDDIKHRHPVSSA
jgi:putative ABC transport system ATP-binding protein